MTHPKEVKAFRQWAKLMEDQARVPDRVQYKSISSQKSSSGKKSVKGTRFRKSRRKRIRRIRRQRD